MYDSTGWLVEESKVMHDGRGYPSCCSKLANASKLAARGRFKGWTVFSGENIENSVRQLKLFCRTIIVEIVRGLFLPFRKISHSECSNNKRWNSVLKLERSVMSVAEF